tara:strand:+ start:352 stop:735 length:384 start_codon:yes stop_codon:yes gene_type:complete
MANCNEINWIEMETLELRLINEHEERWEGGDAPERLGELLGFVRGVQLDGVDMTRQAWRTLSTLTAFEEYVKLCRRTEWAMDERYSRYEHSPREFAAPKGSLLHINQVERQKNAEWNRIAWMMRTQG